MSGFDSHRSQIDNELLHSLLKKNHYLNEVIIQLEQKIQALEAKIKVIEVENQSLKQKLQNQTHLPPKSPFSKIKRPKKLILVSSDSVESHKMNNSFALTDKNTAKRFTMPGSNPFLVSPVRRRPSSDEISDEPKYELQKVKEKSKKYYEDIGNSIVAPLYLLKTTNQLVPPKNRSLEGGESEEIVFKTDKKQRNSAASNQKEAANDKKTILNFIKSPIHKSPNKRKSTFGPSQGFDNFTTRLNMQSAFSKAQPCERLFEDLFVIALEKKELKPGLQQLVSPKIVHTQGFSSQENSKNDCSWKRVIQDFAFPFGVKAKYLSKLNKINKILFSCDLNEKNERTYVFLMQSSQSVQKKDGNEEKDVLSLANPNRILYGICVLTEDFCVVPEDSIYHYWSFPVALCFVTYYPFIKLFTDIIFYLLNTIKPRRLKSHLQNLKPDGSAISTLDIDYFLKELNSEASIILPAVFNYGPLYFDFNISIFTVLGTLNYKIPTADKIYTLEALWGSFMAFSKITFDDFVFIFFAIMLETPICFLSSNLCLLTSTILTFYGLLKPFKWPHPIIFPLPESLFTLFDSPISIIYGLNQSLEFVKQNSLESQYKNIIFFSLDDQMLIIDGPLLEDLGNSIPYFNNFRNSLRSLYDKLNNKKSTNFPEAKKSPRKGYLKRKKKTTQSIERIPVAYTATDHEEECCRKIIEGFFEMLMNFIVKKIPKDLEYQEIERRMLREAKNQQDMNFFRRFLKTQMFCYFIEGSN